MFGNENRGFIGLHVLFYCIAVFVFFHKMKYVSLISKAANQALTLDH